MTTLLNESPYSERDQPKFLRDINALTRHHLDGCPEYRRIFPEWTGGKAIEDIPFLHVGIFKHVSLKTSNETIRHGRTLLSSATTSGQPSRIFLDEQSSKLQAQSSEKILRAVIGEIKCPLLVLDSSQALRSRELSARIAAAMSLKPMASEIYFLLESMETPNVLKWNILQEILERHDRVMVYGFTWILWLSWALGEFPDSIRRLLRGKTVFFIHSGGWKKLEAQKVGAEQLNERLLADLGSESKVIDFYGLVEQVGIVFPLVEGGYRQVPIWGDCLVRDPFTLEPIYDRPGQLQFLNLLSYGSPYHSVLTEDLGIIDSADRERPIKRFKLLGRLPKAEVRGCANV